MLGTLLPVLQAQLDQKGSAATSQVRGAGTPGFRTQIMINPAHSHGTSSHALVYTCFTCIQTASIVLAPVVMSAGVLWGGGVARHTQQEQALCRQLMLHLWPMFVAWPKYCTLCTAAVLCHLQLYAVAAWSSPPSNDPLSSSSSGRATLVQLSLVQPATSLLLTPLFTKRLCAVPLSEQLLAPGRMPPWQVSSRAGCSGGM